MIALNDSNIMNVYRAKIGGRPVLTSGIIILNKVGVSEGTSQYFTGCQPYRNRQDSMTFMIGLCFGERYFYCAI